jgi:hypothetical protein
VLNARVPIGAGGVATATVSKQRGTYRVVVREIVPAPGGVISWDGQTPTNSFRN